MLKTILFLLISFVVGIAVMLSMEAKYGKFELDESYFGVRRVRGKKGKLLNPDFKLVIEQKTHTQLSENNRRPVD